MSRFEKESGFSVASFKALDDGKTGEFEALVSVFGNVDLGGDRVVKGAFAKSLAKYRAAGDPIPIIWNHDWANPAAHIGKADPNGAEETDDGLLIKGSLDLDNPFAAQVYRLLSERRVKEFSFGYNVVKSAKAKDGAEDLTELDLFEAGPTLKGMNPSTQLLAVKSYARAEEEAKASLAADLTGDDAAAVKRSADILTAQLEAAEKAGARLSKDTRSAISQAVELLSSLISSDDAEAPGKASEVEATPEPHVDAKASGTADVDSDLRMQMALLAQSLPKTER